MGLTGHATNGSGSGIATRVKLRPRGKEKLDTKELFERLFSVAPPHQHQHQHPDTSSHYLLQRNRRISASSRSRSIPSLPSVIPSSFSVPIPEAIAFQRSLPESYGLAEGGGGGIVIQRPRPVYPHERAKLHHADTDPFPISVKERGVGVEEERERKKEKEGKRKHVGKEKEARKDKARESDKEKVEEKEGRKERKIPQAVVVTGLHHASTSAQLALSSVLREGEVELDGEIISLPRDFIVIYVCVASLTERPGLHPSLVSASLRMML